MEALDARKKQDIEIAKARLEDTKQRLAETFSRISKAEAEHQDERVHWRRKKKDLQSIEASQNLKNKKLSSDLESMGKILQARTEEEVLLLKTNTDLKQELNTVQEEMANTETEFHLVIDELEEKINSGYLQLQNTKDVEVLMEVGMSSLKPEERMPFVEEVLRKRKKRQEDFNDEMNALEECQKHTEKDVREKREELDLLKRKHSSLTKIYALIKEVREGSQKTPP